MIQQGFPYLPFSGFLFRSGLPVISLRVMSVTVPVPAFPVSSSRCAGRVGSSEEGEQARVAAAFPRSARPVPAPAPIAGAERGV